MNKIGPLLLITLIGCAIYQNQTSPVVVKPVAALSAPKIALPPTIEYDKIFRESLNEARRKTDLFTSKDGAKNILKHLEDIYNKKLN